MRSKRSFAPVPVSATNTVFAGVFKTMTKKLVVTSMTLVAVLFTAEVALGQTLTVNGAATDLYSAGYANLPSTQVGQTVTQNLVLKATGGTVTITSYSTPNPANLANGNPSRTKEFTVGALTGCAVGTAIATNGTCTIPVTFSPVYVGYQTSPLTVVTNRGTFQFGLNGVGVGPQAVVIPGILSTIAGNGTVGNPATTYTGDGGQATAAQVSSHGFAFDALGNLYEAEFNALAIRKITAAGVISTVAGSSGQTACATPTTANSCGDNGQATAATFSKNLPDVAFDSAGNYYIADLGDNKVRRVDAVSGVITTIAGSGSQTESGDGAAATAAGLNTPEAVLVDYQDNIYILDSNASPPAGQTVPGATVRLVNHTTGIITTVAGVTATPCAAGAGNSCGDGGAATAANFNVSASFYLDPTTDNLWIADRDANRIRFVNHSTGIVSTVAGTGATGYTGDGAAATSATFNGPHGIWLDPAGDLYIADRNNNVVRFVSSASGIVSTLAGGGGTCTPGGNGTCGDGGPANGPNANLTPDDLRLDIFGDLFIADQHITGTQPSIRKITQNPTTLTFPTVAVGVTSGPLTASLVNIGNGPLTYTIPANGSNASITTNGPTTAASNAFAQTNATTCGPVYSTTTSGNTLAAGALCNFVVSFTPDTSAGNYTGTLIETDNSAVSTTQIVNLAGAATQATATVGVTTTPNPSTYGMSVAITSTLTGVGSTPTGTVTFTYTPAGSTTPVTIGTGTVSTTNGVTTATVNTTTLPVGTDSIVATYSGDSTYVAGTKSSAVAQVVNQAPITNDTLTASPNPQTTGSQVTIVLSVPDGATAPTAATAVTFTYTIPGSTTQVMITSAVKGVTANGVTTYTTTTTTLPVGTDTIYANFTGDTNYATGSLTTPETINAAGAVGQAVTVTTNPTIVASADTITYSVPVIAGAAVPTGTVAFTSGSTTLGSATFPTNPTAVTCPSGTGTCYTVSISTTALPLTVSPATSTPVTGTYTAGAGSGYSSGTANSTVVVNQVPGGTDAVTAANSTTTVGTADPLTFSIPVVTGAPVPAGTVSFTSGSTNLGSATWPATPTTGTCPSGTGTCYLLAASPSPTNIPLTTAPATSTPVKATFTATPASGYASAAPATSVVVNAAGGSGDTVTVANNPTTFGTSDTLTFNIPVTSGAPAPAGTVVFTAGTTNLGSVTWPASPTASGGFYSISLPTTALPVGSPTTVTGTFTSTAASGYGSAAPAVNVTVNKVPLASDGISASPSATSSGQTVTLTFTVPNVNATAATGTVTFSYNGTTLGTGGLTGTTANGVTTYTTTTNTLPVGTDTITGTYTGDGNYTGGALTTPEAVSSNAGNYTVTASPSPTTVGSSDTLTFVIPVVAGAAVPTGSVSFVSGSTTLGTATFPATPTAVTCPSSTGTCYVLTTTTTALPLTVAPATSTPVQATFTAGGTSGYASGSANTTVVVNQVSGTGDAVAVANNPTTVGTADPITFSIPVVTGVPAPTGTVSFTSGSTNLGSATWPASPTTGACPTGGGTCYLLADSPSPTNIPLTVSPATSTPVTATYTAGSGSGYASTTAQTTVVVGPASGSGDTVTVANNPTNYGTADPLTFSIPVSSGAPAPSGTVLFSSGSTNLGSATWPANPTATGGFYTLSVSPTNIPVGAPTTVTATFTASANSGYASAAPTTTVTVNKAPLSSDGISASPSATASGQTVTLTFTVPNVNSTAATGTVTFTYNGTTLGTANLSGTTANGVTTFTTTTNILPVGTDTITGTYSGDGNYAGGALTTPEAVSSNAGNYTVTASPSPTTVGSTETLTFIVPVVTGAAVPTGSVSFVSGSTTLGTATFPAVPTAVTCPSGTGTCYVLSTTTTALPLTVSPATSTPVQATYTAGGTSGYASGSANTTVVVNQISGASDAVTAANSTTTVGTADPLTFSIPVVAGAPVPTGTVNFTSGSTNLGSATWPATPTTGTCPGGTGSCYLLADSPSPTNIPLTVSPATTTPVTATYTAGAASGYASTTAQTAVDVTPVGGTGGTLTVANNPTTYGTADMLSFSIPATNGVPPPAGSVVFTAGSGATATALGTATWPANPVAVGGFYTISVSPTNIPVGSPTPLTATFTPTAGSGYGASAPTANVTVNKVPVSSDSITASPSPANFGATVTLTFSVPTANNTPPAGTTTVTFTNGTTVLGTANVTGVTAGGITTYTTTTTTLPVGSDTVTGTFTGDGNYASGSLNTTEVINPVGGTAGLTATPNPTTFGTSVTLTETIAAVNGTCPSGPATFLNNGTSIGNAPITLSGTSCIAQLVTSTLPVGTDPITVTIPASGGFAAIASGPVNVVIGKSAGTGDTLTTSPNPSVFGNPVLLTETLPTVGGVAPTGTVTFTYNGTTIGTGTITNGVATASTYTLPLGTDPITATYAGDGNYASVTSGPVNQVVNPATSNATLAAGPNPATFGTLVTLTETITPINGVCPAGPTTFLNNGVSIGTGVITLTNGSCVATLTSTTLPVGTDSITATVPASNGFSATTTGPVALVINKANGPDTLASSPNPSVFGSPVTITDTIPTLGGVAPTGTVTFSSFGTVIGTGTVNAQGVATLVTSTLPVGTDSLTASYAGDGNYAQVTTAPVNQVVNPVPTTATLSAGPNPTTFGTTVTIVETIPVVNNTPPTGQVTFFYTGPAGALIQLGPGTLVNGVASITTSILPVGTDQLTATWPGDGNYSKVSSGPVAEVVNKAIGADMLAVNPDPAAFGTTVTITDTIPTVGGVAPTGTVTFYNNGNAIGTGTVNSAGVATLTTTTLPIGTDPITAIYNGDNNYAPVTTGPVNETITVGNTIPVLSATPNPQYFGMTVTLTESIPGINGVTPTGTVTFTYNGGTLGTSPLVNGVATLPTTTLPIGTDPISATYSGDATYATAQSGPLNVVINKANPTDTLSATPNPSVFGSPVTLTFTVPPVNGVVPTGTVSFYNGTTLLGMGTVNSSGVATLITTALPYGTDTVTGQYAGDNNYSPSAPTTTVTVGPVSPISVVTVPPGSPACGSAVTLTDTITAVNGVALGGTVQFYDNGTAIGTPVPVPASGIVTLTTTALPCTASVITAIYTPPANSPYLPSTGGPTTVNVATPDFTIAATPANLTVNPGDTAVYTVSLSGVGAPFTSPVTLTVSGLPPGATATFGTTTLVPGAGPTTTTLTIVTAPNQAVLRHSTGGLNGIYYGLLLLPLLGVRGVRRKIRSLPKGISYCLAAMVLLGGLGTMTGCGGGYFGPAQQTFTIVVTGTSTSTVTGVPVTVTHSTGMILEGASPTLTVR